MQAGSASGRVNNTGASQALTAWDALACIPRNLMLLFEDTYQDLRGEKQKGISHVGQYGRGAVALERASNRVGAAGVFHPDLPHDVKQSSRFNIAREAQEFGVRSQTIVSEERRGKPAEEAVPVLEQKALGVKTKDIVLIGIALVGGVIVLKSMFSRSAANPNPSVLGSTFSSSTEAAEAIVSAAPTTVDLGSLSPEEIVGQLFA